MSNGDLIHIVSYEEISERRKRIGHGIIRGSFALLLILLGARALQAFGVWDLGIESWQPAPGNCPG